MKFAICRNAMLVAICFALISPSLTWNTLSEVPVKSDEVQSLWNLRNLKHSREVVDMAFKHLDEDHNGESDGLVEHNLIKGAVPAAGFMGMSKADIHKLMDEALDECATKGATTVDPEQFWCGYNHIFPKM